MRMQSQKVYWHTRNMKESPKPTPELLQNITNVCMGKCRERKKKTPPGTPSSCHRIHHRNAAGKGKGLVIKQIGKEAPILHHTAGARDKCQSQGLSPRGTKRLNDPHDAPGHHWLHSQINSHGLSSSSLDSVYRNWSSGWTDAFKHCQRKHHRGSS